ncbi:5'-nucleotidase [Burkholderia multivorans]|uniref:5'-nucleotidase n=1 Tax=Burkholderia multivorans TaxID=87883 RepID=UPI003F584A99
MTSTTKITIAVSARALFDFEAENQLFQEDDPSAYCALQATRLDAPASPGVAFLLVRKLLAFNSGGNNDVEVAILSRNDPVTGLRVFTSARHHGLAISRAIFTSGAKPHPYLAPLEANLFLSAHAPDVRCTRLTRPQSSPSCKRSSSGCNSAGRGARFAWRCLSRPIARTERD